MDLDSMVSYMVDAVICTNEKMLRNYFNYAQHFGPIKKRKYKYHEYWTTLFSDTSGMQMDLYYPKNAEPGEKIKVIAIICGNEKHIIEWIHERPGLIVEKIYPFIIDMLF
jgi:hypothetical protein